MSSFTLNEAAWLILVIGLCYAVAAYFAPWVGFVGIVFILIVRWIAYAYAERDDFGDYL